MTASKSDSAPDDPTSPSALAESFIGVNKQIRRDSSRGGELSNARFEMLHAVFHGGAKPMKAIAEVLGVTARSVTDMADALVAEGYLGQDSGSCGPPGGASGTDGHRHGRPRQRASEADRGSGCAV